MVEDHSFQVSQADSAKLGGYRPPGALTTARDPGSNLTPLLRRQPHHPGDNPQNLDLIVA